ncbi:hypothetical protein Bphy_2540 [Paraburkholderia phymatum STM815]|uniref:Uncharacterized protein n=1 Tax=Paraburkholderia phymatum (strain DSM 17167 / CIP 108236 / LMG 21445 / STM815) TaxID=391038 RepID=B2JGI4_PARP8|nr:hypothetical protein Bphy_2540 [Paraburkholderia phymatum STM815]
MHSAPLLVPYTSGVEIRNMRIACFATTVGVLGALLLAPPLYAQSPAFEALAKTLTPPSDATGPASSDNAAPTRMLHRWPHVDAMTRDQKSLGELLEEHPELSTHSNMTYYSSSLHVGERTRLQPPGSEFQH